MSASNLGRLPASWTSASLSSIADIKLGQSPPSSTYNVLGDGLPFFQGKAEFGALYAEPRVWCSEPGKVAEKDDILLSVRAPVGSTNLAQARSCIGRGLAAIRPIQPVDRNYVLYALRAFSSELDAKGTGTTFKAVSGKVVRDFFIPVAPPAEQERIADALDELLSDLDEGVAALERARAKLKLYRASVLKVAVEGALTADWRAQHPDTEPASALLERILVERRRLWEASQLKKFKAAGKAPPKNWKARYKEPVAPNATSLPALPEGWCWASVDQLIRESLRNGHSSKKTNSDAGIPAFTLTAVTDGDFSETNIKRTSADEEKVRDLWALPDDIFVQRSNTPELVGTTCRYTGEPSRAIFPDLLIRIRVASNVSPAFFERSLQSLRCHTYFRKKAQGISGSMPKIDQEVVERCVVALPSIAEQDVVVEAVEEQLSTLDHLEADIDAKLKSAQALRQSILRDAFAGKLVPQDPNDEPASELLKRIAAEREERTRLAAVAKRAKAKVGKNVAKRNAGKPKAGVRRKRAASKR